MGRRLDWMSEIMFRGRISDLQLAGVDSYLNWASDWLDLLRLLLASWC
jgi:hypothetical protein